MSKRAKKRAAKVARAASVVTPIAAPVAKRRRVSEAAISRAGPSRDNLTPQNFADRFPVPVPPPSATIEGRALLETAVLAMDKACEPVNAWAQDYAYSGEIGFMGYPYLAELSQRSEYRSVSETIAEEMTRKWVRLTDVGDSKDHNAHVRTKKLADLKDEMERHCVTDLFRVMAEKDGFFGRSHLYVSIGNDTDDEIKTPLLLDGGKIVKGAKVRFKAVEPMWAYPDVYNSTDPLAPDFYKPTTWIVNGRRVHASRLLTFVGREMPDMLKPAYAFGGLSLSQMIMPYVNNWLRTRQSISDAVHAFAVMVLGTDMGEILGGDSGDDFFRRVDLFNRTRDNRGTMVIDKETEELDCVQMTLTTLDDLQTQALEQVCMPAKIPRVKFTGQQPSGLGNDSEGEVRTFYDHIKAFQEKFYKAHLLTVIQILQLSLWGSIDPDIGFVFENLWEESVTDSAATRKSDAEADQIYLDSGVLAPEEVRTRLASDEDSPYAGIDPGDMPEPPEEPGIDPDADPTDNGSPTPAKEEKP